MPMRPTSFAFLDHPHPLAFAHRGGGERYDENTMAAFADAVALGYRYLESDVQASRDGVPVLFHDDALDRVMGAPGRVRDHPWSELARLRTPRGEGLARLEEALAAFPHARFNLDAKSDAAVEPMAEAILRGDARERVCVASFSERRTRRLRRRLGGGVCWSPSRRGVTALWLAGWGLPAPGIGFPAVQVPTRFRGVPVVTPRFLAAAHARGVQVHVWTVDEEPEMERLLDLGVDGLMTDRPRALREVLRRRGQWEPDA